MYYARPAALSAVLLQVLPTIAALPPVALVIPASGARMGSGDLPAMETARA